MIDSALVSAFQVRLPGVGLLCYAAIQTRLHSKTTEERERQRRHDEGRGIRAALAIVNAENLRFSSIAEDWETTDLLQLAANGDVDPGGA